MRSGGKEEKEHQGTGTSGVERKNMHSNRVLSAKEKEKKSPQISSGRIQHI